MIDLDSPWKDALDLYFDPFLQLLFPEIFGDIDWSHGYEFLDKELLQVVPEAEQGKGVVDKFVKVWRKNGEENWLLLHIEVQSQEEKDFARRMFVYNYRIFDRYNRDVVSLAVLGDDRPTWRPSLYKFELWRCRKEFEFPVIKLLDCLPRADELEKSDNPMATVVLAHLRALETRKEPGERRNWKFRLVRNLYERGMAATEIRQLFRLIDWMMQLPRDIEGLFREDLNRMEEDKHMPYVTSIERLAREEGLEQGLEQGREEGREQGREEGREQGKRDALLLAIEKCLHKKFGEEGGELMSAVQAIRDWERLLGLLTALNDAVTLAQFREMVQGQA